MRNDLPVLTKTRVILLLLIVSLSATGSPEVTRTKGSSGKLDGEDDSGMVGTARLPENKGDIHPCHILPERSFRLNAENYPHL